MMERLRARIRSFQERRSAYRTPLLALAFAAFGIGCFLSLRALDISPSDIRPGPLALLALLTLPSLIYGGIGLSLLARSAGTSIPPGRASVIGAYAYLAELLPLPGGAIVRTGALVGAGGSLSRSTALVLGTAVLWIALALVGAGLTLLPGFAHLAWPMLFAGTAVSLMILAWLSRVSSAWIALLTLGHRIFGICLMGVRIQIAFAAFGTSAGFLDSMPFVLALLLGSASSIAPAGLGISESLAALAATTSAFSPALAFLAVGLDRMVSLVSCGLVAFAAQIGKHAESAMPGDR